MGRHTRDDEPVPHPQDRAGGQRVPRRSHPGSPRTAARGEASGSYPVVGRGETAGPGETSGSYPAVGRSEASGAFRTPGRSSISDAFGIAGRGQAAGSSRTRGRGESTGSFFVSGGGEPSGVHPAESSGSYAAVEPGEPFAAGHRGETSGSYPAAGLGDTSGAYPSAAPRTPGRRGKTPGAQPVPGFDETPGAHPAAGPGEGSGGRRGESSGSYPAARRGKPAGGPPAARLDETFSPGAVRGQTSGAYPAAAPQRPGRRGKTSAASLSATETAAERTEVITRHGEASGNYPITPRSETSGSFRVPDAGKTESTGGRRRAKADRTAEPADGRTTGRRRVPGRSETTGPHRAANPAADPADATGPHRAAAKSETAVADRGAGKSDTTGSHRIVAKGGEATGSHRIVGKKAPRRRIATWPIACAVLAALIGLGIIGWNWADSELNSRAEAQATSCTGGTSQMRIIVTPSVQKPVTAAADRWNQAATVVHGQCVHVTIDPKPSAQVLDALVGRTNLNAIGGLPAAWLPESSYWVSELTTKKPELIGSPAQSVANARSADYPFVGLAGNGIDDTVLRAAQTFREYLEQPAQQADFANAGIKSA